MHEEKDLSHGTKETFARPFNESVLQAPLESMDSSAKMRTQLERLPQELYDEIFHLTFTAEPGVRCIGLSKVQAGRFTARTKSPHLLRISRATRQMYAASYYGNGTFLVVSTGDDDLVKRWGRSLLLEHYLKLGQVYCIEYYRAAYRDIPATYYDILLEPDFTDTVKDPAVTCHIKNGTALRVLSGLETAVLRRVEHLPACDM